MPLTQNGALLRTVTVKRDEQKNITSVELDGAEYVFEYTRDSLFITRISMKRDGQWVGSVPNPMAGDYERPFVSTSGDFYLDDAGQRARIDFFDNPSDPRTRALARSEYYLPGDRLVQRDIPLEGGGVRRQFFRDGKTQPDTFILDTAGRILAVEHRDSSGGLVTLARYYADGKTVASIEFFYPGGARRVEYFDFGQDGRPVAADSYENGTLARRDLWDTVGVTKSIYPAPSGNVEVDYRRNIVTLRDPAGAVIRTWNDASYSAGHVEIQTDPRRKEFYLPDGRFDYAEIFNDRGVKLERLGYHADGNVASRYVYQGDIRFETFEFDGSPAMTYFYGEPNTHIVDWKNKTAEFQDHLQNILDRWRDVSDAAPDSAIGRELIRPGLTGIREKNQEN